MPPPFTLAILGDFGLTELVVIALAAVMIFGRRLPQVAARGFAQFQRLRRTLTQMWRETGIEDEMRRIQRDLDRSVPRNFDPATLARRETREIERRLKADPRSRARRPGPLAPQPAPEPQREEGPRAEEPAASGGEERTRDDPPPGGATAPAAGEAVPERTRSPE